MKIQPASWIFLFGVLLKLRPIQPSASSWYLPEMGASDGRSRGAGGASRKAVLDLPSVIQHVPGGPPDEVSRRPTLAAAGSFRWDIALRCGPKPFKHCLP